MKRFAMLIVATWASLLLVGSTSAAADMGMQSALAGTIVGDEQLSGEEIVLLAEDSVNQFAAENGLSQTQWHNLADQDVVYGPCGQATAYYAYYYCPRDSVAYIGYSQAEYFNDGTNRLAAAVLVAHEWGHHLQHVMNPAIRFSSKAYENGADCVGGAWLKWFVTREGINLGLGDVNGFWQLAIMIESHGEPGDTHGTRYERAFAMFSGYAWGLASCNGYTPTIP
ncbi:neutral zinc metallopeptidase [Candidatus Saccharibacteria bacterium]|nr:neutral zinc metallopeptidase [Candidatus Saccharibacteria bacterium]